jgi:hypothetical protein
MMRNGFVRRHRRIGAMVGATVVGGLTLGVFGAGAIGAPPAGAAVSAVGTYAASGSGLVGPLSINSDHTFTWQESVSTCKGYWTQVGNYFAAASDPSFPGTVSCTATEAIVGKVKKKSITGAVTFGSLGSTYGTNTWTATRTS